MDRRMLEELARRRAAASLQGLSSPSTSSQTGLNPDAMAILARNAQLGAIFAQEERQRQQQQDFDLRRMGALPYAGGGALGGLQGLMPPPPPGSLELQQRLRLRQEQQLEEHIRRRKSLETQQAQQQQNAVALEKMEFQRFHAQQEQLARNNGRFAFAGNVINGQKGLSLLGKRSREDTLPKKKPDAIVKRPRVFAVGNSNFPLPSLKNAEAPSKINIPLLSYRKLWDECKTKEGFLRRLHAGKVPIIKDTSVVGRYSVEEESEKAPAAELKSAAPVHV